MNTWIQSARIKENFFSGRLVLLNRKMFYTPTLPSFLEPNFSKEQKHNREGKGIETEK